MGRLTTTQFDAAAGNNRHRMVWTIYVPESAGSASLTGTVIHDDNILDTLGKRVIDPGVREVYGFNISRMSPGQFEVGEYTFVLNNGDGKLVPFSSTSIFTNPSTAYQAAPQECDIKHDLYLWLPYGWEVILSYTGRIKKIQYEGSATQGSTRNGIATITTYSKVIQDILDHQWGDAEGDDQELAYSFTY